MTSGTPPNASLRSRSASPRRSRAVMSASRSSIMLTPPARAGTKMSSSARSPYRVRSVTSSRSGADGRLYLDIPRTFWEFLRRRQPALGPDHANDPSHEPARQPFRSGGSSAQTARHQPDRTRQAGTDAQLEADFDAPLARLFHFSQVLLRDHHPCQLVVAELGMP